jgi:hypothetical protein
MRADAGLYLGLRLNRAYGMHTNNKKRGYGRLPDSQSAYEPTRKEQGVSIWSFLNSRFSMSDFWPQFFSKPHIFISNATHDTHMYELRPKRMPMQRGETKRSRTTYNE